MVTKIKITMDEVIDGADLRIFIWNQRIRNRLGFYDETMHVKYNPAANPGNSTEIPGPVAQAVTSKYGVKESEIERVNL